MSDELTTAQVAERFGVSANAVCHWVRAGRLTPTRREGLLTYWFSAAAVQKFEYRGRGRPPGATQKKRAKRKI